MTSSVTVVEFAIWVQISVYNMKKWK